MSNATIELLPAVPAAERQPSELADWQVARERVLERIDSEIRYSVIERECGGVAHARDLQRRAIIAANPDPKFWLRCDQEFTSAVWLLDVWAPAQEGQVAA